MEHSLQRNGTLIQIKMEHSSKGTLIKMKNEMELITNEMQHIKWNTQKEHSSKMKWFVGAVEGTPLLQWDSSPHAANHLDLGLYLWGPFGSAFPFVTPKGKNN